MNKNNFSKHVLHVLFISFFCKMHNKKLIFHRTVPLRRLFRTKIIYLIIYFYAMMHRTIVQNKIISIICSWFFFCPANIYSSLEKVWLGRTYPKLIQPLNFYLRRKIKIPLYSESYAQHSMMPDFQFCFSFI